MVLGEMLVEIGDGTKYVLTLLCLGSAPSHLSGCPGQPEHVAKYQILSVRC